MNTKTYLLVGDAGSGKTTVACTCEHPTLIIDVDCKADKMENIRHLIESGDVTIHPIKISLVEDTLRDRVLNPDGKIKKQPEGYLYVVDLLNRILQGDEEFMKYNTIVLDSMTRLTEHLKRLLIYLRGQGHFGKKKTDGDMCWPSWGAFLSNLEELITELIQTDKNLICTVHKKTEVEHDDMTDTSIILGYWPLIDGQMSKKLAGYFDEVFFMEKKITKARGTEYLFRTVGTKYCARSSFTLPEFVQADIKGLKKIHKRK